MEKAIYYYSVASLFVNLTEESVSLSFASIYN